MSRRSFNTRLIRSLVALAVVALVALHAWILWRRLADGVFFESDVALRWLGAGALGLAALWLHRQGVSLVRGRPAAVFWLTVVVLHAGGPAPLTDAGALAHQLPPELMVLLGMPIGLRWLAARLDVRAVARLVCAAGRAAIPWPRPSLVRRYPPVSRRPPPLPSM